MVVDDQGVPGDVGVVADAGELVHVDGDVRAACDEARAFDLGDGLVDDGDERVGEPA